MKKRLMAVTVGDVMLHTFASFLRLVIPFLYLLAAWRFGDWKNWRKYYSSILFLISVDFGMSLLTYNFSLWTFQKSFLVPNHTITDFLITFFVLSPMVFIFLSKYPFNSSMIWQIVYGAVWVIFSTFMESFFKAAELITYHHGWNLLWSILVWMFMYFGLRVHFSKPFWAWLLCFACVFFIKIYFHIPIRNMK
ncbi:CBO0543 family protein [Neobacillus sp. NRS-1170]|uniref:CBO0543 family protein n=1 Tax=Neobacillus sp. NRS-1170 TaxID=3233898 RepID=UPI003D27095E